MSEPREWNPNGEVVIEVMNYNGTRVRSQRNDRARITAKLILTRGGFRYRREDGRHAAITDRVNLRSRISSYRIDGQEWVTL